MNKDKKLAVFIDCENISPKYINSIFVELANYGEVTIRKAYHNWSNERSKNWKKEIQKYAIEPIQVFSNINTKNSIDIDITIDVMDTINESYVNSIILVSSDSDFTKLGMRIKAKGFEAIGFGEKKTPEILRNSYTTFIELPIKNKISTSNSNIISILKESIQNTKEDKDYSLLSQIGGYLKNKGSQYNPKNYGGKSWSDIFEQYPHIFSLSYQDSKRSIKIVYIK